MRKHIDQNIDHDTRWKEIIKELFEYFVGFFMPDLYPLVDFGHKPGFLKQELYKIIAIPEKKGKKINKKKEKELMQSKNPFAIAVLVVNIALLAGVDKTFVEKTIKDFEN